MISGAIFFLVIASLILLQSFGIGPFGDDEPVARDVLEEDWEDRAEDDVTVPGEEPAAFRVDGLLAMIAARRSSSPAADDRVARGEMTRGEPRGTAA